MKARSITLLIALSACGCGLLLGVDWDRVAVGGASVEEPADVLAPPMVGASADAISDDASDGGVVNDGGITDGGADAKGPPPVLYVCDGGTLTDCAQCPNAPLGCVYCSTSGPELKGRCLASDLLCFNYPLSGFKVCPCRFPDASTCPVGGQACRDYTPEYCTTCGDDKSGGSPCKGGGTCDAVTKTCQ